MESFQQLGNSADWILFLRPNFSAKNAKQINLY